MSHIRHPGKSVIADFEIYSYKFVLEVLEQKIIILIWEHFVSTSIAHITNHEKCR